MKTMRFYGWSWAETLATPISGFWTCYGYIDRLRAAETLDRLNEQSFTWLEEQDKKDYVQALEDRIGTVIVEKPVFDREGWRSLHKISHE